MNIVLFFADKTLAWCTLRGLYKQVWNRILPPLVKLKDMVTKKKNICTCYAFREYYVKNQKCNEYWYKGKDENMFLFLISLLDKKSHILFLQLVLNKTGHRYFKMRNFVISQL